MYKQTETTMLSSRIKRAYFYHTTTGRVAYYKLTKQESFLARMKREALELRKQALDADWGA
jgi:hypothetical protein